MLTFLAVLLALIALGIFCQAIFLKLGLHWAKSDNRTLRTAFLAMTVATLISYSLFAALIFLDLVSESIPELLFLFSFLIVIVVYIVTVQLFFGTSILRTLQAILPTILSPLLYTLIFLFVFQPFVGQSFVVPTNSMAPTVLGRHFEGTCPDCGLIETTGIVQHGAAKSHCICQNFHTRIRSDVRGKRQPGDRIFVAKYLRPNRWDIAAFKLPSDPQTTYIKRVVGLPGETIHIKDGFAFADGVQLTPPEHLANLTYSTDINGHEAFYGTEDKPAVLGSDEYFVLGDNSERAMDARFWRDGADGHNPYAVPESHIFGVATTIYWPPKRWNSFK